MKVIKTTPTKSSFEPISLLLTFETPEEALSFRAVLGGISFRSLRECLAESHNGGDVEGVSEETAFDVCGAINGALRKAIVSQGIDYMGPDRF